MFLTVAGSSCSGKTTVIQACAEIDGLVVHDFDESGVPSGADVVWRQRSLQEWIQRAVRYQAEGFDMLLTGQSPLGEVLASPSAIELNGIAACLLDVEDELRWQRLENRDPGMWDLDAKRSFIDWAGWHRGHAADPGYRPGVIMKAGDERMRWDRWCDWSRGDPRWTVQVIDTTDRTVDRTATDIRQWIVGARAAFAAGQLGLDAGRWPTGPRLTPRRTRPDITRGRRGVRTR